MPTVVMTGGTAGLGRIAAERILLIPGVRLLMGARTEPPVRAEGVALDLNSLASVRAFTEKIVERLSGQTIDMLILNAGMTLSSDDERTIEGYERQFGVNHLAHYEILRSLAPHLSKGARVIITTSDTHDPSINKIAPPVTADANRLAFPSPDKGQSAFKRGFRAYASSKLCNILTVRAFDASSEARDSNVTSIAYNPGFTPGTSIGRHASLPLRIAIRTIVPVAKLFKRINTVEEAGRALADLALGEIVPPTGRFYASLVKGKLVWPEPSDLGRDDAASDALWTDSALLLSTKALDATVNLPTV